MNSQERAQQRRIVGWWLDVDPGTMNGLGQEVSECHDAIRNTFNDFLETQDARDLVPANTDDKHFKLRITRVEEALSGIAISAIAMEDGVKTSTVNEIIRYTLLRLRSIMNEENRAD